MATLYSVMVRLMKDFIIKIRNMALEYLNGLTEKDMRAIGKMANKKDLVF
jgi:hypothetical protein